jgi:hypothetical protein
MRMRESVCMRTISDVRTREQWETEVRQSEPTPERLRRQRGAEEADEAIATRGYLQALSVLWQRDVAAVADGAPVGPHAVRGRRREVQEVARVHGHLGEADVV